MEPVRSPETALRKNRNKHIKKSFLNLENINNFQGKSKKSFDPPFAKVDHVENVKKVKPIRERPKMPTEGRVETEESSSTFERPRRAPRINYEEAVVPDDDHYLCK